MVCYTKVGTKLIHIPVHHDRTLVIGKLRIGLQVTRCLDYMQNMQNTY